MKLKELRLKKDETQKQIADKLGITQFTYCNYEKGKTEPDINLLIKLADYYDVSLDYLCGRTWNNKIGYIPDEKKEVVKIILQLNDINTIKALSYCSGLLAGQN